MSALKHVQIAALAPERFKEILTEGQARELDETIERGDQLLGGRVVWNVNSTMRGGGVAEMLASLVAYARGAGVDSRWVVMRGEPDFFRVTKRIHNMLHGSPGDAGGLGRDARETYERTCALAARELAELAEPGDVVVLHDPQTAGLVQPLIDDGARVVWRCHVGIDLPNDLARETWRFLLPYVAPAAAYIFSREAYAWDDLERSRVVIIPPSIDAFSAKNQSLDAPNVRAVLAAAGIIDGSSIGLAQFTRQDGSRGRVNRQTELHDTPSVPAGARTIVQVSRWDRLKDHVGVLHAFCEQGPPETDAHLVLAGPSTAAVADDPEGPEVLREVLAARDQQSESARARIHVVSLPMVDPEENAAIVNALQRNATIVAQKSLAEGFGLTVAEAMWKGRPVVASRVGGIQDQIVDQENGVLVDPLNLEAFGRALHGLLREPNRAEELGRRAREQVRDGFLGPRALAQYVDLFGRLLEPVSVARTRAHPGVPRGG
jgi:trehalose synthase